METVPQDGNVHPTSTKKKQAESGHARNLASFGLLIQTVQMYEANYKPANPSITVTALRDVFTTARLSLDACNVSETAFDKATDVRADLFKRIRPLCTRISNSFASAGIPESAVAGARTITAKIQGAPSKVKKAAVSATGEEAKRTASNSRRSYVQMVEHFKALRELVRIYPEYDPNEDALKNEQLTVFEQELEAANISIDDVITSWRHDRAVRQKVFYEENYGMVPLAALVKKYVASLYGVGSVQYKEVRHIPFRTSK